MEDIWGNPYQLKTLQTEPVYIPGVYSLGRDGVSRTEGEDPDDLASWHDRWKRHYDPPWYRNGGMLTIIGLLGVLLIEFIWISVLRFRNPPRAP